MITYRQAKKLLPPPGDVVYVADSKCGILEAKVLEVCALHLRTDAGPLDFQDHGYTWWLTRKAALENANEAWAV